MQPEMACRTCGRVLNVHTDPAGRITFVHPASPRTYGHEPDPVPTELLDHVERRCDFCSDPFPVFTFRSGPIRAVMVGDDAESVHDFGDAWDACIGCTPDVLARRPGPIWRRTLASAGLTSTDPAAQSVRAVQASVLATLHPGRTLIVSTNWPHTTVPAPILPKVRDRLATLLRSDIHLPHLDGARQLADGLTQAHLYTVDDEFTRLARHAAADLPATTIRVEDLPAPHGLLVWSEPIAGRGICATSWTVGDTGVDVILCRSIGGCLDSQSVQALREHIGWLVPVHHRRLPWGDTVDTDAVGVLVTTWLLIAQQASETVPADVDRAIRKAYARTQRPAPEVRIVRIRGRVQAVGEPSAHQQAQQPDGYRRWVSGFWRQQPYGPRNTLRRPKYIFAYLRGPDDAPIVASTTVRALKPAPGRHPTDS